jgi:glucose-1-phosphate adenylyltransferase
VDKVLAIVMAGGAGERLQPLTRERSKGAVPFGGKYRLIDLTLSNCINSGLRRVFVLTQYLSESLNQHIQEGWSISSAGLGDYVYCIPAQQKLGEGWYGGTADSVRQNLDLIRKKDGDNVLILSGDHIYKMDYSQLVAYHDMKKADLTISAVRVRKEQAAGTFAVLEADKDYRLTGFEEKPAQPKTLTDDPDYTLASMGIYVFKVDVLLQALHEEGDDFGKHVIPRMMNESKDVFAYDYDRQNGIKDYEVVVVNGMRQKVLVEKTRDSCYWKDVGSLDSYYQANMELLAADPPFSLYGERWPMRTYQRPFPPVKCIFNAKVSQSILCDGSIVSGGTVCDSVISPGVIVEQDAVVEKSIVFDNVIIEHGARIGKAIIDKNCIVRAGASIGYDMEADKRRGFTISDNGIVVVPKGTEVSE